MSGLLLDTCVFAWMLLGRGHVGSLVARTAIDNSEDDLFVSSATFYEIAQKVRLGKWDEMAPYAEGLISHSNLASSQILVADGPICLQAGQMAWDHRDPFDRLIAATALRHRLPIVSADRQFDGVVARIW